MLDKGLHGIKGDKKTFNDYSFLFPFFFYSFQTPQQKPLKQNKRAFVSRFREGFCASALIFIQETARVVEFFKLYEMLLSILQKGEKQKQAHTTV
jgi:hypothetical protein